MTGSRCPSTAKDFANVSEAAAGFVRDQHCNLGLIKARQGIYTCGRIVSETSNSKYNDTMRASSAAIQSLFEAVSVWTYLRYSQPKRIPCDLPISFDDLLTLPCLLMIEGWYRGRRECGWHLMQDTLYQHESFRLKHS